MLVSIHVAGAAMVTEVELDRAFANAFASSRDFRLWLLGQTKFAHLRETAILLDEEQARAKPTKKAENWWRHWWCELDDGTQSETDIFLVFGFSDSPDRIALHIEDKPPHGKFRPNQGLDYERRALFMRGKPQYMNYSEFTTILLAPAAFIARNCLECGHFDCLIPYETLAEFIPLFAESLCAAS